MRPIIILISLLLLGACAKAPVTPDWISGNPSEYSSNRYLLGRGEASSVGLARDRARADLAKNFAVQIQEQTTDELLWQQGGNGRQGLQSTISRNIRSQTDRLIEGVKIADTWRAETGGNYHALAVLDRLQAGSRIRAQINQLDRETAENINRARHAEDLPDQISAARNALEAQLKRRHQQALLTIVDVTGTGIKPKYQVADLKNDFDTLLKRWKIAPQMTQDDLGGGEKLLAGALGNIGVLHRADATAADYLLVGQLESNKLNTADGWYWLRGVLTVSLQDRDSGQVFGTHQWPFKVSSRQADMVEIRARGYLSAILNRELLEVLTSFGQGQKKKR
jgi:hypothetical protein